MPIYEYQCERCGHQLEAFQKISASPLVDCPECRQATLRKLISPSSFRLKGTGWYVTDFKDKDKKKPAVEEAKDNNVAQAGKEADKKPDNATGKVADAKLRPASTKATPPNSDASTADK